MLQYNLSDIPELPDNANITKVLFCIYFLEGDTGDGTKLCSLFVMSKEWNSKEVTWNNATNTDTWEQLDLDAKYYHIALQDTIQFPGGGDRLFPHAAVSPVSTASRKWEMYTITNGMKNYLKNPDSFHGFLVKPYMGNASRTYASSDYNDEEKRPKLIIKYHGTGISQSPKETNTLPCTITTAPKTVRIYIPLSGNYQVTILDLKGRRVHFFNGHGKKWYSFQRGYLRTGIYILRIFTTGFLEFTHTFLIF